MKKIMFITLLLSLSASIAMAASFSPLQLKLSAPAGIQYKFDGTTLQIPVTVSGTSASVIFSVFTSDKASSINKVRNGYLGWHYVNKTDTSVFISPAYTLNKGNNTIVWDGKGEGDKAVPLGDYTYYLWGWDSVSAKVLASSYNMYPSRGTNIEEKDASGKSLANPLFMRQSWGGMSIWTIGNDPSDVTLVETSNLAVPENYNPRERVCLQPGDYTRFFSQVHNEQSGSLGIWKFQRVPNGNSIVDAKWGDNGIVNLPVQATGDYSANWFSGAVTDGQYLYATICRRAEPIVKFYIVDFNGSLVQSVDISDWWVHQEEADKGAQLTGGPNDVMVRNGKVFLNSHTSCLKSMVNPSAGLEEPDDFWVWNNGNGDFVSDHNFDTTSTNAWVCFDYNVGPYTYTISSDANLFAVNPSYDMGAVSFSLFAPDGTGIGYQAFAGETAAIKWGLSFCDNGSAFDGLYVDNNSTGSDDTAKKGLWFVAQDSFKGKISNQVTVADAAPAAFTVAQNTPNPFNPATTITFSLVKAGMVTVDVFNAAGQKIDTIVNSQMTAGSHSVNWNAAKFSAGVYFCTVKSGSLSRTVKMTLLK